MTNISLLLLVGLFIIKHFIVDFLWQTPYQFKNKHILGHPGGIIHALLHAVTSWVILGMVFSFFSTTVIIAVIAELFIHYFVDFMKMNFNIRFNYTPSNSPIFWYMLGFDQLLHYCTYLGMIYYII